MKERVASILSLATTVGLMWFAIELLLATVGKLFQQLCADSKKPAQALWAKAYSALQLVGINFLLCIPMTICDHIRRPGSAGKAFSNALYEALCKIVLPLRFDDAFVAMGRHLVKLRSASNFVMDTADKVKSVCSGAGVTWLFAHLQRWCRGCSTTVREPSSSCMCFVILLMRMCCRPQEPSEPRLVMLTSLLVRLKHRLCLPALMDIAEFLYLRSVPASVLELLGHLGISMSYTTLLRRRVERLKNFHLHLQRIGQLYRDDLPRRFFVWLRDGFTKCAGWCCQLQCALLLDALLTWPAVALQGSEGG